MDELYLIKVKQEKLKVGISYDAKKRIANIQNAGGYPDNQIETKIFSGAWQYEEILKSIFKEYQLKGEWYEYDGLVEFFYNNLSNLGSIDLQMIEYISKKYDDSIFFDFKFEESKINLKKALFESKRKAKEGLLTIDSSIVNLSQSQMEMIKNGKIVYLYRYFVDFVFDDIFVTWNFEEKSHIIAKFLAKLNVHYKKL